MPLSNYSKNGTVELFHFTSEFKLPDESIVEPKEPKVGYDGHYWHKGVKRPHPKYFNPDGSRTNEPLPTSVYEKPKERKSSYSDTIILDPVEAKKKMRYHSTNDFRRASTPRTFFYVDLSHKEDFFRRDALYKTQFPEDKIYDMTTDNKGLRKNWDGYGGLDNFFDIVKKNGYEGLYYEMRNGDMNVVVLFVPVEAHLVQQVKENFFRNTNRMKKI